MDYLDQPGIRKIRVNLAEETIEADILGGRLTVNGKAHEYPERAGRELQEHAPCRHRAARGPICTFAEGLAVMDLIDASERALQSRMWISA